MNLEETIYKILREKFEITGTVNLQTDLIEAFGFESISFVELAALLSTETGIKVDISDVIEWTNVNSIIETYSRYTKSKISK